MAELWGLSKKRSQGREIQAAGRLSTAGRRVTTASLRAPLAAVGKTLGWDVGHRHGGDAEFSSVHAQGPYDDRFDNKSGSTSSSTWCEASLAAAQGLALSFKQTGAYGDMVDDTGGDSDMVDDTGGDIGGGTYGHGGRVSRSGDGSIMVTGSCEAIIAERSQGDTFTGGVVTGPRRASTAASGPGDYGTGHEVQVRDDSDDSHGVGYGTTGGMELVSWEEVTDTQYDVHDIKFGSGEQGSGHMQITHQLTNASAHDHKLQLDDGEVKDTSSMYTAADDAPSPPLVTARRLPGDEDTGAEVVAELRARWRCYQALVGKSRIVKLSSMADEVGRLLAGQGGDINQVVRLLGLDSSHMVHEVIAAFFLVVAKGTRDCRSC